MIETIAEATDGHEGSDRLVVERFGVTGTFAFSGFDPAVAEENGDEGLVLFVSGFDREGIRAFAEKILTATA